MNIIEKNMEIFKKSLNFYLVFSNFSILEEECKKAVCEDTHPWKRRKH